MKRLALIILILGSIRPLSASHIVGGEIMYQYLNTNNGMKNYKITLLLYIDCFNGNSQAIEQDKDGYINVFRDEWGNKSLLKEYCRTVRRTGPVTVSDVNYVCIKTKPNACVDKYTYETNISLPVGGQYLISFERCCRNNSINNIINPENTGATYWTSINTWNNNNSPFFKSLPPNFLCTNAPLKFDHSAKDADGDSLVYELYQPYDGAGTSQANSSRPFYNDDNNLPHYPLKQVFWEGGYDTYNNQIDGNPTLSIDRETGRLTLTPTKTGQFVIGIKVLEYRNGILIGETKRDFQFNVSNCVFYVVSSFFVPKLNCSGNEVTFTNRSEGGTDYLWDFGVQGISNDTSTEKNGKYSYNKTGNYRVRLITKNNTCSDTSDYDIIIKQNFVVKIPDDTLICGPFTKTLSSNIVGKTYLWNTGERTPSINVNKGGRYWLSVTDNPCVSKDTIDIINDLSTLDLGPDSVICRDSFVQFTYAGKAGYKTYLWDDGTNLQSVFIHSLGQYRLSVTNQNNCPSTDSITFVLYPPPKIHINDTLFCKGTSVLLDGINRSAKTRPETTYEWNTGELTQIINPSTPGMYIVTVRNKLCTVIDTAVLTHIETGLDLGPDTFYCGPVDRWLRPKKGFSKYVWHDYAEVVDYHATSPGKKKITITTKEGCIESDSVTLTQFKPIDGGLGNDTTICISSTIYISAIDSMVDYLWNTGETTRTIRITNHGLYKVTVTDPNGCMISDSLRITEQGDALPVDLFMPNAFTPNDDRLNETYPGNRYSDPGSPYIMRLYNRWGEKIFESTSPTLEWDGTIKGEMAPQDVYVYYVKYVACDNVERWFRGTFTLLK